MSCPCFPAPHSGGKQKRGGWSREKTKKEKTFFFAVVFDCPFFYQTKLFLVSQKNKLCDAKILKKKKKHEKKEPHRGIVFFRFLFLFVALSLPKCVKNNNGLAEGPKLLFFSASDRQKEVHT